MKKLVLALILLLFLQSYSYAGIEVYTENEKFGLRTTSGTIITKADYKKLVRLGNNAWIMQDGTKFGIIKDDGTIIVEPKYSQAERVLGKFVKFK